MNKISLITKSGFNNLIFKIYDNKHNRDNCLYSYYKLREKFLELGCDLSTCDINLPSESDMILYIGLNQEVQDHKGKDVFLLTLESPHVDSAIYRRDLHNNFKKIFTWNDNLVDGKKYIKVNYSYKFPDRIPNVDFFKRKLCCTIAGNKSSKHPDELYSERVKLIRWFEKNHLNEFDLYGTKWDEYRFGHSLVGRALNKVNFLRKSSFSSYSGRVDSKSEVMKNYKFSICYENIKNQPGYITEKIFDAFFSGSVPVYWGASNINEHIPANCFINKEDFRSLDDLYRFMKDMSEETFYNYLKNIENYLNSSKADQFKASFFANTIVSEILEGR